jgi:hypothetical protein
MAERTDAVGHVAPTSSDDEEQLAPKALLRARNHLTTVAKRAATRRSKSGLTGPEPLGAVAAPEKIEGYEHAFTSFRSR